MDSEEIIFSEFILIAHMQLECHSCQCIASHRRERGNAEPSWKLPTMSAFLSCMVIWPHLAAKHTRKVWTLYAVQHSIELGSSYHVRRDLDSVIQN